jgi:predicted metal-dependent peptidase
MEAQMKMSRAVTQLVVRHPFFGSVCLSVKMAPDPTIPTMCTDGTSILWSPSFVDEMIQDECTGVLAHEVMHIVMKHMLRRGERDPERWNYACDYVINPILLEAGFVLPKGALFDPQYANLTAEAVYDRLPENIEQQAKGAGFGEVVDAKDKSGKPLSPAEQKQMEADIDSKVMMAANAAKAVGKLPAKIDQMIQQMQKAQVDWRDVLRRFIGGDQPDDYSMRRPQRTMYHMAGIVAPSIQKAGAGNLVVGIDTSGSVSHHELTQFLGELNAVSEDTEPTSITVITCDTHVQTVQRYERGELIEEIKVGGRGGTMVTPVFQYIEENELEVDSMIYFSDMEIWDYPEQAPHYPTLWVSSWDQAKPAPFGETTYLKAA